MTRLQRLLHTCVAVAVAVAISTSGTLSSKQEARLHPAYRILLHQPSHATGQQPATIPVSPDANEAIIYTSDPAVLRSAGIQVQSVYDGFVTAIVETTDIMTLAQSESVIYVDPGVTSTIQMDVSLYQTGASLLQSGFLGDVQYKGKGAIVLIYDTGIDWKHLDFRDPADPTKSRILAIWDQTLTPGAGESSPSGFTYGVEYTNEQINNELDGSPAGSVRETDTYGHGTHVAGIAAGNGAAAAGKFAGMAPQADIIVVKGGNGTFSESRVIDGLTYASQKASELGKPIVVNLSLGGQVGPHNGSLAEELAINSFVGSAGRVVCVAAGNDGGTNLHKGGSLPAGGSSTVNIVIPSYIPAAGTENDQFTFDLWCKGNAAASLQVTSPTGITFTVNSGDAGTASDQGDGTIDAWDVVDQVTFCRNLQVRVHDQNSAVPRSGTWRILITNGSTSAINYDAWLTSSLGTSSAATVTDGDNKETVTMPGTSGGAITIGSYVTRYSWPSVDGGQYVFSGGTDRTGNYSLFSSVGPTADGRQKPEVSAPGESIVSSLSSSVNMSGLSPLISPDGKHTVMEGTSMATPHVTGAVALLLGANNSLTAAQLKTVLSTTADGDAFASNLPDYRWGYGKMDVLEATAKSIDAGAAVKRTVISYDQSGSGYYWKLSGANRYAVGFSLPDSGQLAAVQVNIYSQDVRPIVGSGSLHCELLSSAVGVPGSRIGNAVDIPLAQLNPGTNNTVSLLPAVAKTAVGTNYFVVLSLTGASDTLAIRSDASSSGTHSMTYDGTQWSASARNFRIRPVVVSSAGNFSTGGGSNGPYAFVLRQNFPNPFNLSTEISYSVPAKGHVTLKVFDILGKEVAKLVDGEESEGIHAVSWRGTNGASAVVSSGVYFYRLESSGSMTTKKMVLIK